MEGYLKDGLLTSSFCSPVRAFFNDADLIMKGKRSMAIFEGAGVAMITPMKANGEINYDKMAEFIDYQVDNGTDAIIVCGTTGEASTLSEKEHLDAIEFTVSHVNKRIPVIAGTGSNCTESAVFLSQEAQSVGVDGLLVVTPYYNKATQKGLIAHYTTIAKSVDLPIIMYNVPSRTGCKLEAATIAKLVKDVDNIVGVKEATGDIAFATQIMYDTQGDIDMYSGNDDMIVPMLSIGGKGVISVLSNVAPEDTHNICAEYFAGNVEKSRELQIKYLELIHSLFCEVNPIPVKKALELMGFYGGNVRLPLTQLEPAHTERLKKAMIETGILA